MYTCSIILLDFHFSFNLQKWQNAGVSENIKLPQRNEFIPTNFEIMPRDEEVGYLLYICIISYMFVNQIHTTCEEFNYKNSVDADDDYYYHFNYYHHFHYYYF